MHYQKKEIIEALWRLVISIDPDRTTAEEEAMQVVMQAAMSLRNSLNESQLILFGNYVSSLSDYHTVSNKEAFFKGISLGISLFSEKTDDILFDLTDKEEESDG